MGALRHGHTFLQLCDIRGYENILFDMVDEEPKLIKLISMLEEYNLELIKHMISAGCEKLVYSEDLGMQTGPMLSPKYFRKYILPSYKGIMKPAKDKDIIIYIHSDGDIRT